jgi:hypothetical protein
MRARREGAPTRRCVMSKTNTRADAKARKQAIIEAGRGALRKWLEGALAHGTIYYAIESVSRSGMNRKIVLATIVTDSKGKPTLQRCWPGVTDADEGLFHDYVETLDVIARDWTFSFRARAFDVSGGGMDMVFHLIDRLARVAGLDDRTKYPHGFANAVRRESF